jgi:hypothetical protein
MGTVVIRSDRPAYKIMAAHGFYAEDFLYEQGSLLYWDGIPNEEMEPLNDLARDRLKAEIERLDDLGRKAAAANGRAFVERPKTLEGAIRIATLDARRPQLIEGDGGVPLMGARQQGPKQAAAIEAEPDTAFVRAPIGKRSIA